MSKRKTVAKQLGERYGGTWKYCGAFSHRWECDDGAYVQRCSDVDQFDEPLGSSLWLYGRGTPQRILLGMPEFLR